MHLDTRTNHTKALSPAPVATTTARTAHAAPVQLHLLLATLRIPLRFCKLAIAPTSETPRHSIYRKQRPVSNAKTCRTAVTQAARKNPRTGATTKRLAKASLSSSREAATPRTRQEQQEEEGNPPFLTLMKTHWPPQRGQI